MSSGARPLGSTYRIQLNHFGFRAALDLVGYLDDLGIETVYLSPITRANPGSSHGYDVVDPTKIDPELGTEEDLEALLASADAHRMRVLIDIVPNHMSTSPDNRWWTDLLRLGEASEYAPYFDIDWEAGNGRVVLPVLDRPLEQVLEAGELRVGMAETGSDLALWLGDRPFPLSPGSEIHPDETGASKAGGMAGLLEAQHYRLIDWRLAAFEVNYRRFFDINDLVGVRVEDPAVYSMTHAMILRLAADPRIAGVRVDHIDGLAEPEAYLERLQRDLNDASTAGERVVLVEKILARDERVPPSWATDGTTGYEFADLALAALTDHSGATSIGDQVGGANYDFLRVAVRAKREVMDDLFPGQVNRLAEEVAKLSPQGGLLDIHNAVVALTECLPVYRTYTTPGNLNDRDVQSVDSAVALARELLEDQVSANALADLRDLVLAHEPQSHVQVTSPTLTRLCVHWQQLSSPVAAKGVEDTALYRFCGLMSSADVGSDPGVPGIAVSQFHEAMTRRNRTGLSATSTHDSKRSEDARSRLAVLSQIPREWNELLVELRAVTEALVSRVFPERVLPAGFESSLYQSVVAIWPPSGDWDEVLTERVVSYCIKAAREAKTQTTWSFPNESFEQEVREFVSGVLAPSASLDLLRSFVQKISVAGAVNACALVVMKVAAPGVPDFFQGTETWRHLLVDPDNRRQVDFDGLVRQAAGLPEAGGPAAACMAENWRDGSLKMFLTRESLKTRRSRRELFARGAYIPLLASGTHAGSVIAFARRLDDAAVLCVVPRLSVAVSGPGRLPIGNHWGDTSLAIPPDCGEEFRDAFTGNVVGVTASVIRVADLLTTLPVALLLRT